MVTERLKYVCVIVVYIFLFIILIYGLEDIMNKHARQDMDTTQILSRTVQIRILFMN